MTKLDFAGHDIPDHIKDQLNEYVTSGIPPSDFLLAILNNDLVKAYENSTDIELNSLTNIVNFMYNKINKNSWGSKEKVEKFIGKGFFTS